VIRFALEATDPACSARAGRLFTAHGEVATPVFMPVGTHAAVRAMTPEQVRATGARIVLANTYHLLLRPGPELVKRAGGLHSFMAWDGPILTDSGGFQVFSLKHKEITPSGVRFKNEVDGSEVTLTPERSIEIQHALGADIIMAFDECTPYPATDVLARRGVENSLAWLERCVAAHRASGSEQALFPIVQGSVYPELRRLSARETVKVDAPGYAIGGVSVGEGLEELRRIVSIAAPLLPAHKPRYLMGVGLPEDLVESVERGMDMFDCVIPTRYARSATLFTRRGRIRMNHRRYRRDFYPIDTSCDCYACKTFTRAYLHHLYAANEILAAILGATHNVRFYQKLMAEMRDAITAGRFLDWKRAFYADYGEPGADARSGDAREKAEQEGA
jgi:queuine tRNA-ribosyltransferase